MKSSDPRKTLEELLSSGAGAVGGGDNNSGGKAKRMMVKTCGLTSVEDAELALQAGASMLGVIFVPTSPRAASVAQAKGIVEAARRYSQRTNDQRYSDITLILPSLQPLPLSC